MLILGISSIILFAKYEILEKTSENYLLKIDLSELEIYENNDFTSLDIQDWTNGDDVGAPALPYKILNFAVPPKGGLSVRIVSEKKYTKMLNSPVRPIPKIVKANRTNEFVYELDNKKYSDRNTGLFNVSEITRYRFYDLVPLKITPVLYDHNSQELTIHNELILEIKISGNTSFHNEIEDNFEEIYRGFILNYEHAKYWKTNQNRKINYMDFSDSDFWFKIETANSELIKLSYEELSRIPDFCEPDSIRIFTNYRIYNEEKNPELIIEEIPIYLEIENAGTFGENDLAYFYNEERFHNKYSEKNVFWLTFGGNYQAKPKRLDQFQDHRFAEPADHFNRYDPVDITRENRQSDCLIIYPYEFQSQVSEFVTLYSTNFGLDCNLAYQQNIFDQFDESPQSIKDYIENSFYSSPDPDLQYVILLGSGTNEWSSSSPKNKIITFDASDDNFVDFNSDNRPELIIGRIPAQNTSDLDLILERTRKYIEEPNLGWWKNTLLFSADDENKGDHLEGTESNLGLNHTQQAENTYEQLNHGVLINKVYGIEYDFDEYQNKPDMRTAMMDHLNSGTLVWYFIGHGNEDVLGDEDYFRASLHMSLIDNEEHLPLFIAASCNVGQFDEVSFDCVAERLLFWDNGGSIASLAATRSCGGSDNTTLIRYFLKKIINERKSIGESLLLAKLNSGASLSNSKKYNILGSPILDVIPPFQVGNISGVPDSIRSRQTVNINGTFDEDNETNMVGEIRVFDTDQDVHYENTLGTQTYSIDYVKNGNSFFKGQINIENGNFQAGFIVPDDIHNGDQGRIIGYAADNVTKEEFSNYYHPVTLSEISMESESTDEPEISLWLDSKKFYDGDYVSTTPTLIAAISDSNGINLSGISGHKILLLLDDSIDPINVTDHFIYDVNSYKKGELVYELDEIEEGQHSLQLIVFDNFNTPAIAQTNFIARSVGEVSIEQMLPYPNPMSDNGNFTFVITEEADITISIYTISGRKIRNLAKPNCAAGYNMIFWDTKDGDGDHIANNTYFYKIKAKQLSDGKISEKIGKVVILK